MYIHTYTHNIHIHRHMHTHIHIHIHIHIHMCIYVRRVVSAKVVASRPWGFEFWLMLLFIVFMICDELLYAMNHNNELVCLHAYNS